MIRSTKVAEDQVREVEVQGVRRGVGAPARVRLDTVKISKAQSRDARKLSICMYVMER